MKTQQISSALIVDKGPEEKQTLAAMRKLKDVGAIPSTDGNTLIHVAYSSLNYKDALAVTGKGKILRQFPIVPGIDLAGSILEPDGKGRFQKGDEVILTGCGIGEEFSGGYANVARVKEDSLLSLPPELTARQAMAIGTAGFTAMLALLALEDHGLIHHTANWKEIIVTGAAGGVGSIAIALLAGLGHHVTASSGRSEEAGDYLQHLGASKIIPRSVLSTPSGKLLDSEHWFGGIDTVGGQTLASVLQRTQANGSVAACGLASDVNLPTTVLPFILRGVNLLGINANAAKYSREFREYVWKRLTVNLSLEKLEKMTQEISLNEVIDASEEILVGRIRGRIVVDLSL